MLPAKVAKVTSPPPSLNSTVVSPASSDRIRVQRDRPRCRSLAPCSGSALAARMMYNANAASQKLFVQEPYRHHIRKEVADFGS